VFTKSTSARGQEVQNYSSKQTTETQTSILIEAVDPKFLKPPPGHKKIEEEEGCEIDISIENEEPTRDTSNYLDIAVLDDNNSEKQVKHISDQTQICYKNTKCCHIIFSTKFLTLKLH